METIECIGKDGETSFFQVEFMSPLEILVRSEESQDFFYLALHAVDDNTVQITEINHNHNPAFKGKGIPEILLPHVANKLRKQIISSSHKYPLKENEYRSIYANKMWNRLVGKALAVYDTEKDIYKLKII